MLKIVFITLLAHLLFADAVVFMYHRFGESRYPSTNITKEQFRFQLDYLQQNHYNVWPLSKIVRYIRENKKIPPKTVALTMDDAYKSVYTVAYPMLKEKGFAFTVFVNTTPIDNGAKAFMTWDEMRIMQKNGAEFANHSRTHPFLLKYLQFPYKEFVKALRSEIEGAQRRLQEELGVQEKMFAYPYGEYTRAIKKVVGDLGYVGVSQVPGILHAKSDLNAIPRFPMSQRFASKRGFLLKLHAKALPLAQIPTNDHLVDEANNPPVLTLTTARRFDDLACYISDGTPIAVQRLTPTKVRIRAKKALRPPREHYTCTAKADKSSWYWYSFFWVFPKK